MVAANLACALAGGKAGCLCLWKGIFGDLRWRKQLGMEEIAGLSQLLEGKADKFNNIRRLESSGLCVLLAGDIHTSPMEFMEPGRLAECLDSVSVRL